MEPAPLFNNPREVNTQVVNLDDFRVPDLHYSPAINAGWDIPGVPEAEENDDQVCPSILPPEAVWDAQTGFTLPAHDHHDEAVRLPSREEMINAQQFDTIPQPVDARLLHLRRQEGRDFAQRDALGINVCGNFVDNECQQHFMESSEIEVPSQEQLPTTPPPGLATTTANSDGVDVREQKQNTVEPGNRIRQKKKRCTGRSLLGLRKTVNARLKKKARTARLPALRRGSHTLPESGRRQAMVALHDTLRELLQPENSEISAKTDKASVVLEATDRIVSLLEGRVDEILEELKTARQSRNILPAMPTAYFSASVHLHVSGFGEMWVTIHSLEQARELHRLFVRLVSSVINVSRLYRPEMVHLDISTVVFGASYTIHTEPNAGSDSAVDELYTTLQMVVHCEIFRTQ